MIDSKSTTDIDAPVVGAGQAGLAAWMALRQAGAELHDRRQPRPVLTGPVLRAARAAFAGRPGRYSRRDDVARYLRDAQTFTVASPASGFSQPGSSRHRDIAVDHD